MFLLACLLVVSGFLGHWGIVPSSDLMIVHIGAPCKYGNLYSAAERQIPLFGLLVVGVLQAWPEVWLAVWLAIPSQSAPSTTQTRLAP